MEMSMEEPKEETVTSKGTGESLPVVSREAFIAYSLSNRKMRCRSRLIACNKNKKNNKPGGSPVREEEGQPPNET
jgi:hypothetical protein